MSLPDTCPFCGSFAELRNGEKWVGYTCITTIHAGHDARRMQSITCAGLERTRLLARVAEMEAENKGLRDRFSNADTERNAAQAALKAAFDRVAELEAREKQAREDEAWANGDGLVELQPVTSGWVASTLDGLHSINATAPTIRGALRALRDRLEAKP